MADGTVKIEGVDANFHSSRVVTEVFEAMVRQRAFDAIFRYRALVHRVACTA